MLSTAFNDLWVFDPASITFIQINLQGVAPIGRSFFGFTAVRYLDSWKLVLYGGFNTRREPELADTWEFDVAAATWQQINSSASFAQPTSRAGAGLTSTKGKVYMFGGGTFDWTLISSLQETLLWNTIIPRVDSSWVLSLETGMRVMV